MTGLGFCLPYNSNFLWDGRETELNKHWFTIEMIENDDFLVENFQDNLTNFYDIIDMLVNSYTQYFNTSFRLINMIDFIKKPQIIKIYEIDDTCLCVIKTMWLKIFQRKYKNYYNNKMNYYKNPRNIMNRSVYGKWI